MTDTGYLMALLGGLLTLLSPCSALLLPAFFAYSFTTATRLAGRTALFYAGLCTTLVPLGAAGSFASRPLYGHHDLLITIGGWTVIALGLAQILGLGFGSRRLQQAAARLKPSTAFSTWALGAVYGLAGFCAGGARRPSPPWDATRCTTAHSWPSPVTPKLIRGGGFRSVCEAAVGEPA